MTYRETNKYLEEVRLIMFSQHYPDSYIEAISEAINLMNVIDEVGHVRAECYNIAQDRVCKEDREADFYDYLTEVFNEIVRDGLCEELVEEEKNLMS